MPSIETVGDGERQVPYKQAAIAGATAFVLGYLLTFGTLLLDGAMQSSETSDESSGSFLDGIRAIGLFFFDTQFVETEFDFLGATVSISLLEEASTEIPVLVYRLIPIVVIAGVAMAFVSSVDLVPAGRDASAKLGAMVVVGYLPLALFGLVFFPIESGGSAIKPDAFTAIFLAGMAYPVACGALGGAIAWHRTQRRE